MQLLDLEGDYERKIFLGVITPLVMGLCAVAQPLLVMPWLLRRALRSGGELRMQRLIRIPALLAFGETMVSWFADGILFNGGVVLLLDRPASVSLVGVVVRQMRELADQSIQATNQVRAMLETMTVATHQATAMSNEGVETALAPLRTSGEQLRELAALSRESTMAVRQITEAMSQQHQGVDPFFAAVRELDELTTDTLRHLDTPQQAATAVTQATGQVSQLAERYV